MFQRELVRGMILHQLALLLTALFMCLSVGVSFWLILAHATHYLIPYEQKQIIRILAMIPIYSIISFFSLVFHHKDVYLDLVRNIYEAYVVASFFTLMCYYVAPTLHEQKEYFRNVRPKPWIFPLKGVDTPRSGLTWFNIIYVGINQFCITRPFFGLIAVISERTGHYCDSSTRPQDGHLWIVLLQGAFILIAMYCVMQFYVQLKEDLAPYRGSLKVLCIKLVLFVMFWQTWLLGLLSRKKGPLQPTAYLSAVDIHVGIPCMLICFEMTVFAIVHHWAFPWTPYDVDRQLRGPGGPKFYIRDPLGAFLDALNPWDYAKAGARGLRWLFHGVHYRKDDSSYRLHREIELKAKAGPDLMPQATRARIGAHSDPGTTSDAVRQEDELKRRHAKRFASD
ncbi:DUF300-domain-containing protein [Setomelanomma holmii]|uniref:DUF300-domain-containing protein n=1 Tax=Setomelanomma holmii TaxID=210430 RepID=A0A9P4HCE7_9PLEO|nr:DUF300-domain-containing protein [Setomelanomma holmii]